MRKKLHIFRFFFRIALGCVWLCVVAGSHAVAQSSETAQTSRFTAEELFEMYLANDLNMQKLAAEVEKQILSQKETSISNGFDIQLSTGTVRYSTGKSSISFEPNVSVQIPQAQNLTASVSSSFEIGTKSNSVKNSTSLSLGIDIISDKKDKRNVTLLKAERSVLEAKRSLQNSALNAEVDFYNALKNLYNVALSITTAQKDLYDAKVTFEKILAQGYEPNSAQYRTANLEVLSSEHAVQVAKRQMESEAAVFFAKCGIEYSGENAVDILPDKIPITEAIDIDIFEKSNYVSIESAMWANHINSLSRAAEKNFSLAVNGGYTFNNENTGGTNTIDAGVTANYKGIGISAGTSIPIANGKVLPDYSLSVSLSPNTFRTRAITEKQNDLTESQENISIAQAQINYETDVLAQKRSLVDLEWNYTTNKEYFDMYTTLEKDYALYLQEGIITESEYMSSSVNKERYRIQVISNEIDKILYNDKVKLLFCRDDELVSN